MPRIVILGCGTGVGKTRLSVALLRALGSAGCESIGLKPVESGIDHTSQSPGAGSDAEALFGASTLHVPHPRGPRYALALAVSPHLAARAQGVEISLNALAQWVKQMESDMTPLARQHMAIWSVVETAGGVFSPLAQQATNFELARALDPATWVLVAADALGVLHEVSATLQAMRARGRLPEHVVLSASRARDASTGTNAKELSALGIVTPTAVLERDDDSGVQSLVKRLLAEVPHAS